MLPTDGLEPPSNNSGQPDAVLPPELLGFSWAGFLGSWVWALGNRAWIGLLALVPCVGFMMRFTLGSYGNEWAWRNKRWKSLEHFRRIQRQQAWIGLGLSIFSWSFCVVATYPIFGRARENEHKDHCPSNLKQIALGWKVYAQDYDGKCPPGTTLGSWKVAFDPYLKRDMLYHCPSELNGETSYSLNSKMAGANLDKIADSGLIPVIFDSEPRHLGGREVAFADGHVKWYEESVWKSKILPRISAFVPDKSPSKR